MTIGYIQKDVCCAALRQTSILVEFIPVPRKGATDIDNSWYHKINTLLKPLREINIGGTGYKWDCTDGFKHAW